VLPQRIKVQIEYYFSDTNLKQDEFLQGLMDSEGWVKARFLEKFPRLKEMGAKASDIIASIANSEVVETADTKIRRKNDWQKYLPSQETVSHGYLEAMALRIEDHHKKMEYFKKKDSSKSEKRENTANSTHTKEDQKNNQKTTSQEPKSTNTAKDSTTADKN